MTAVGRLEDELHLPRAAVEARVGSSRAPFFNGSRQPRTRLAHLSRAVMHPGDAPAGFPRESRIVGQVLQNVASLADYSPQSSARGRSMASNGSRCTISLPTRVATLVHRPSSRHRASIVRPTGSISHAWDPRARVDGHLPGAKRRRARRLDLADPAGRVREMEGSGRSRSRDPRQPARRGPRISAPRCSSGSGRICQRSGPSSQPSGRNSILPSVTAAAATRSAGHGLAWSSPSRISVTTPPGSPTRSS